MQSVLRRAAWRALKAGGGRRGASEGGARAAGGGKGDDADSPLRRLVRDASQFGEAARGEGELQWATQPYAQRPPADHDTRRVDPRDACVWLFPGQGSQHVGMGRRLADIPPAKDVYDLAAEVLGYLLILIYLLHN